MRNSAPGDGSRRRAEAFGLRAERAAAWLLRAKGWRILARRLKTPLGEIDIVARRGRTVAFVEVKARPDLSAGMLALQPRQRERLQRAAILFLAQRPRYAQGHDLRFDLVVVRPWRWPVHIADAWQVDR
ncbi:YraN family protein [Inquilinus sp. Marseille-Q2685]|uniref:YraN family protein n=1 Tax=Inquilinus sp. Marseille-Q2685 TaxID=2866581 RepID=UPI001CE4347C|nr:YraN family protein [Inquilinus sp. Marseille-Q2685]